MKNIFVLALMMFFMASKSNSQTVTIYRGGVAISPVYSTIAAAAAASQNGDSIVLSAHTFYENGLTFRLGIVWQGTITTKDTSIIDAKGLNYIATLGSVTGTKKGVILRNIICQNGSSPSAGIHSGIVGPSGDDGLILKGNSIIRYCKSKGSGGAVSAVRLYDYAKLMHNTADSFGGGVFCLGL